VPGTLAAPVTSGLAGDCPGAVRPGRWLQHAAAPGRRPIPISEGMITIAY